MESLRWYLHDARSKGIAVPHFNVSDIVQLHAVVDEAVRLKSPVVVGVSEGERAFWRVGEITALVRYIREQQSVPIFLNADHTHSIEKIREALDAGFDAVLFDAGKKPLQENIQETIEVVSLVKQYNAEHGSDVLVEGEMGYIGSSSALFDILPEGAAVTKEQMTDPVQAAEFVRATGVDLLAPAVGNVHGMFSHAANPALDIARVKAIVEATGALVVLHGGSGISRDDFLRAISAGVSLVHISTELRVAWRKGLDMALLSHPNEIAPYKVYPEVSSQVGKVVREKIELFYHYGGQS